MGNVIKVGMADLNICKSPDMITTLGLGSCIGIALYDPVTKIGGLAHIMLPDSTQIRNNSNIAKFADTGITDRVNDIINDRFWSDGKKPDRCDVLQELIDCGDISAKDAKSTQKAWNCRHSRQSNDKKR